MLILIASSKKNNAGYKGLYTRNGQSVCPITKEYFLQRLELWHAIVNLLESRLERGSASVMSARECRKALSS